VLVRIPRIQVTSRLVPLALDEAGAMEVPQDGQQAGWYTKAPSPGALGPAVIAGHVTWNGAPGIFVRLGSLRRTDRVEVLREDGLTAVFAVRRVVTFAKSEFPTESVYGSTDHAALRLITCAGRFDPDRRRYDDNVVVFADLVEVRQR
jgi:sortase (surface protein transpeptidase)